MLLEILLEVALSLHSFTFLYTHHHHYVAMNDSLRPETNTRNTQKCSACRTAKKKVRRVGPGFIRDNRHEGTYD